MKWYQRSIVMWLCLFFFPPIGIFLLWKYNRFSRIPRVLLSAFFGWIFLIAVTTSPDDETDIVQLSKAQAIQSPMPASTLTAEITSEPTIESTTTPSLTPTAISTPTPTATPEPTITPTEEPTPESTAIPTEEPTEAPTPEPIIMPTEEPIEEPTPTETPTPAPVSENQFIVYWGNTGNKVHISPKCRTIKNGVLSGTLEKCKSAGHTAGWCGVCSKGWSDERFLKDGNPYAQ